MSIDTRDIGSTRMIFEDRERLRRENAALRAHNAQLVARAERLLAIVDRQHDAVICLRSALTAAPAAALEAIRAVQRAWLRLSKCEEEFGHAADAACGEYVDQLDNSIAALAQTFGEPT